MSNLLTVVSAASDYGVTRKIVEEAIKLAQLEPTHTYPSGKGFAGLYEPEAIKKAIDELTAAKARAKQEAEEAARTAKQQAGGLSVAQFQEVQGRLDDIVSRIDDVNKTMVEIQVAEDEVGDEYRTLAEQNRLTFKAITDLASATSSTFKELHAMMVAQVNRLSDVMVQVDAFMLSTKEQTAQTGADVKAILTLIREVSKPAPTAPAANQPISPAPPPRDILPPLPTPPAPAPAPAVKPAPAPIAVKTVTPSKVTPIAAPKQATKAAAVLPTPERLADMPVTAITQAFAEIGAKTPRWPSWR